MLFLIFNLCYYLQKDHSCWRACIAVASLLDSHHQRTAKIYIIDIFNYVSKSYL
jgi:hypothetical protein